MIVPERLPATASLNRVDRKMRLKKNPCVVMENSVIEAILQFNKADGNRAQAYNTNHHSVAAVVFDGGIGAPYVEAIRDLPITMEQSSLINSCEPHRDWLNDITYPDYFNRRVRGVSLSDIEKMHLPLQASDISKITALFRDPYNLNSIQDRRVQDAAVFAASDTLANPEQFSPQSIHPLHERLAAYFDFYAKYLTSQNAGVTQDLRFVNTLIWAGSNWGTAVGVYTAASLRLSPSSVMNLYREHADNSGFGWLMRGTLKSIGHEMQFAYHNQGQNALPSGIRSHLYYSPKNDQEMSKRLTSVYSEGKGSSGLRHELVEDEETRNLVNKLRKYRNIIVADAIKAGEDYPAFQIEHPVINQVLVGLRKTISHFDKDVTLVLLSADGNYHLTLDFSEGSRLVYGIPGSLSRKVPHIDGLLIKGVVGQVVEQVEARHPELNPKPKLTVVTRDSVPVTPIRSKVDGNGNTEQDLVIEEQPKTPKRKQLQQAFEMLAQKPQPEAPIPAQSFRRAYTVDHDELLVRSLMGRVRENEVRRIMNVIERFETGAVRQRKVIAEGGTFRIRSGDWRVKLVSLGGNSYSISEIVWRDQAYEQN